MRTAGNSTKSVRAVKRRASRSFGKAQEKARWNQFID